MRMSFKKMAIGKRAITGSVMILFVCTIIILLILVIFALGSYAVKSAEGIKDYGKLDRITAELGGNDNSPGLYAETYWAIERNIKHTAMLKSILNCEGEFNGKNMKFYEVLGVWNETNTQEISDFASVYGCGGVESAGFLNKNFGKYFRCGSPYAPCIVKEPPKDIDKLEFKDENKTCGIKFELSPINIQVIISHYCGINF